VFYHPEELNLNSTAVLDGFTISGGGTGEIIEDHRHVHGGGMYNDGSSPTLVNLIITDNYAREFGGGIYNNNSSSSLANVTFSSNYGRHGGGGMYNMGSSLTLTSVTFSGNTSPVMGGGIYNGESNLTLTNTVFSGNTAREGGGIYNQNIHRHTLLTNVTFNGDTADSGSSIYNNSGNATLRNCIIWDDDWYYGGPDSQIYYSLIKGNGDGSAFHNVYTEDSPFISDTNLRLHQGSPARDAGTNEPYEEDGTAYGVITDLDGNLRIVNNTVDMGAYEYQLQLFPVTFGTSGSGTVTARVAAADISSGDSVVEESTVSFAATPASGWMFSRWDINGTRVNSRNHSVVVESPITATAYFSLIPQPVYYSLTVAAQGEGSVTPAPGTYSYLPGEIVSFSAQPAEGWEFLHWLINGEEVTEPSHSLMVLRKTTATAIFAEIRNPDPDPDPDPDDPTNQLLVTVVGKRGYTFDGEWIDMVPCYYKGSDTMMPVRLLEAFGVEFDWDQSTLTATLTYNGTTVKLTIGSTDALINGIRTPIIGASGTLIAPELAPGRTMIPLRFVSEHLKFKVHWEPDHTITISLPQTP
jgi:predicted outer membrane repeat protein